MVKEIFLVSQQKWYENIKMNSQGCKLANVMMTQLAVC